jgi:hypothetical protein
MSGRYGAIAVDARRKRSDLDNWTDGIWDVELDTFETWS